VFTRSMLGITMWYTPFTPRYWARRAAVMLMSFLPPARERCIEWALCMMCCSTRSCAICFMNV